MGSQNKLFLFVSIIFLIALNSIVAIRIVSEEHHSERPKQIPRPLRTKAGLENYFKTKGFITDSIQKDPKTGTASIADVACSLLPSVLEVRNNYKQTVANIVAAATTGSFKGQTYSNLSYFVDTYDRRLSGSPLLEESIDYLLHQMHNIGATNIQQENVPVSSWTRGNESLTIRTSRGDRNLAFYGLGGSVSTVAGGITANVIVVGSLVELTLNTLNLKGKIVVLNYGGSALSALDTTGNGYDILAKAGALAALYRSAATFSLNSPHTRRSSLYYTSLSPKIPIGYVSFEVGDYLTRLQQRGTPIQVNLVLENTDGQGTSRNIFGDLQGRSNPDQFVLLAAHTDSWDVAQAAQDDGAGVLLALKAFELIKNLLPVPRRTLRLALWTAEEWAYQGSATYLSTKGNVNGLSVGLEADYSCLASTGLIWFGTPELGCLVNEIISLVGSASSGVIATTPSVYSDMDAFAQKGIPVINLNGDNGQYFWYHHSAADTMTAVNSTELDRCLALWTSTAYILSDLKNPVSRLF